MKPSLLILAAGIGSRYGGLKQVDGMGPHGEAILEFSIFDALRAGFGKIVFVIRKDIEAPFREKVGRKIEAHADVHYAFQELDTALDWLPEKPERQKPWGTGHAVLSARHAINEPFATINADDFYGADAFAQLGRFLQHQCTPERYGMVAYQLANTLSENGAVSRGVCSVTPEGFLHDVVERTKIERYPEGIAYTDDHGNRHPLPDNTPVSMNLWGFHHTVFEEADAMFRRFVHDNLNNPKAEFYIPTVVNNLLQAGKIDLQVLHSDAQWYGVTYPDDKSTVQNALKDMAENGHYPTQLF
jgi:dTDP-glucose pyrophosphorylase